MKTTDELVELSRQIQELAKRLRACEGLRTSFPASASAADKAVGSLLANHEFDAYPHQLKAILVEAFAVGISDVIERTSDKMQEVARSMAEDCPKVEAPPGGTADRQIEDVL